MSAAEALRDEMRKLGYSDTAINAMGESTTMMQRAIDARKALAKADTTPEVSEAKFLAARVRRVCRLAGLTSYADMDNGTLSGAAGTVLGLVASVLERANTALGHSVGLSIADLARDGTSSQQAQQPAEASERDADRLNAAYDSGASNARQGVQEVTACFDDLPFDGCPESWVEKPFARIRWFHDSGDASVGQPAQSGWTLSEDQSGTVIATLTVTSASAALDAHWRVVPVELTDEMHNAFKDNGGGASNTWRAILAAAPLAQQVGGGDSERRTFSLNATEIRALQMLHVGESARMLGAADSWGDGNDDIRNRQLARADEARCRADEFRAAAEAIDASRASSAAQREGSRG